MALCSSLDGCSGGTYNKQTSSCKLVSGNGPINKSKDPNENAILSEKKMYLEKLEILNKHLIQLNQDI